MAQACLLWVDVSKLHKHFLILAADRVFAGSILCGIIASQARSAMEGRRWRGSNFFACSWDFGFSRWCARAQVANGLVSESLQ